MTIVVGTDFSDRAQDVAAVAGRLATKLDESLLLVHVVDGPVVPRHREQLARALRALNDAGVRADGVVEPGPPVGATIARVAERANASLVVVGAQGEGLRPLLGSAASSVLRHGSTPVLVVRAPERLQSFVGPSGGAALVCVALDETDTEIKSALALLARLGPVRADVAHYRVLPEQRAHRRDAVRLGERDVSESLGALPANVTAKTLIRDGFGRLDAHLADLAAERNADIVVVGSHRRHGLDRIRDGSIAEGVVKHAASSVLVAGVGRES
jgi:nucleotide-binding universal stress UspA family protein